jgi:hypothetical protein
MNKFGLMKGAMMNKFGRMIVGAACPGQEDPQP